MLGSSGDGAGRQRLARHSCRRLGRWAIRSISARWVGERSRGGGGPATGRLGPPEVVDDLGGPPSGGEVHPRKPCSPRATGGGSGSRPRGLGRPSRASSREAGSWAGLGRHGRASRRRRRRWARASGDVCGCGIGSVGRLGSGAGSGSGSGAGSGVGEAAGAVSATGRRGRNPGASAAEGGSSDRRGLGGGSRGERLQGQRGRARSRRGRGIDRRQRGRSQLGQTRRRRSSGREGWEGPGRSASAPRPARGQAAKPVELDRCRRDRSVPELVPGPGWERSPARQARRRGPSVAVPEVS